MTSCQPSSLSRTLCRLNKTTQCCARRRHHPTKVGPCKTTLHSRGEVSASRLNARAALSSQHPTLLPEFFSVEILICHRPPAHSSFLVRSHQLDWQIQNTTSRPKSRQDELDGFMVPSFETPSHACTVLPASWWRRYSILQDVRACDW